MEVSENKRVVYEFGTFVLDPRERTLFADGVPVHLAPKEFDTLLLFIEHNGRALTKDELMSAVWHDAVVDESNVARQISRLRKILNANDEALIETIPKYGYRFSAELRQAVLETEAPIILEQRAVKRVRLELENGSELVPLALAPVRNRYGTLGHVLLLLILIVGVGYLLWWIVPVRTAKVDPYEPVRLTDSPDDDTAPSWTQDGRVRYLRIFPDKHLETWIVQPDGSGKEQMHMPEGKRVFVWSPDGKKIQYVKQGDDAKVYLANSDGTGETLLPFRGGLWSPDSKLITYHQRVSGSNFDIFTYAIESGEVRNITKSDSFEADPSFSPDGKRIVFSSTRDGNAELYSMNIDGTDQRRLTNNPGIDSHGAYSPDGTQILVTADRGNENGDIYLINADGGGEPLKLVGWDKSNESAGPGGWSPDGTKVVFYTDRNGKDDVYVVNAEVFRPKLVVADPDADLGIPNISSDGKKLVYSAEMADKSGEIRTFDLENGETQLIRKTEISRSSPHWSPDGNWIAFGDRIAGNSEVCLMRSDGLDFQNLTQDPALDFGPTWSSDGKRIIFLSMRGTSSNAARLYVMNADGSDVQPITPKSGWETDAVMSADGRSVIFSCDREDAPGNMLDICEIQVDGSGEKRLLTHPYHDTHPVLSPDEKRIAFTATSDGNSEIYLMNRDGTGLLRLTRNTAEDVGPEWSTDGKSLFFSSNRDGRFAIYKIDLPLAAG